MPIEVTPIPGDRVRIPDQRPGVATVVSRYSKERAVLMHPDDFHRLETLDTLISTAAATEPLNFTDAAMLAHQEAETPSEPVTDPTRLNELFG